MPIQCLKCKSLNKDAASYCNDCGTSLQIGATYSPEMQKKIPEIDSVPSIQPDKPKTFPEEIPKADSELKVSDIPQKIDASQLDPSPQKIPRITAPPPFIAWFIYLSLLILTLVVIAIATDDSELALFWTPVLAILTLPIFWWRFKSSGFLGVVTNLRQSQEQVIKRPWYFIFQLWFVPAHLRTGVRHVPTDKWVFNLQQTEKNWQLRKDKNGFKLPAIQAEYLIHKLHGPALEEGFQVAIKGRKIKGVIIAKKIWNLTPTTTATTTIEPNHFWGQVIHLTSRQAPDMRYQDGRHLDIWSFRLQPTDKSFEKLLRDSQGNLKIATPVEIRAQMISGPIQEGDKLEISGQVMQGTLYAHDVKNHSAGGAKLMMKGRAGTP